MKAKQLTPFQVWLLAARPKTLPAAAAPVIVGTAVAIREEVFHPWAALSAFIAALLIQIGTNFANDVFDYKKGADTPERLGPTRVTESGLLSPRDVTIGMWVVFGLAVLIGIYLVVLRGWLVILIGLLSIMAGVAYTGGPLPFGYKGLGDAFVFIFFGLVAVGGTYFVQAGTVSPTSILAAIPMGFLATAILVVNNLRDIDTDRKAGKKTLAVRLGRKWTLVEYVTLVFGSYLIPFLMWVFNLASPWVLLTWFTILRTRAILSLINHHEGGILNKALAKTGRLELEYGLLFSLGLIIGM